MYQQFKRKSDSVGFLISHMKWRSIDENFDILNEIKSLRFFFFFFASRFKHMQIRVNAESAAFYRSDTNSGFIPHVYCLITASHLQEVVRL